MNMTGENYSLVRERIGLESWDSEANRMVTREPTNAEILRLLDALHCDVTGIVGPELQEARSQRVLVVLT